MRFKLLFINIRFLLLANVFIFGYWCMLLVFRQNATLPEEQFTSQYLEIEKMKQRIETIKQVLKNRYPSASDLIGAYLSENVPTIYAITPTYSRLTQKADLTRLSHTLRLVPNFHWIVVEDSDHKTLLVTNFLKICGVSYTQLNIKTDINYKLKPNDPNWLLPRGVDQRNVGLDWIRKNINYRSRGVVYFLDDDNTYSLKVFEEMRYTQFGSVWPVGLTGGLKFEGPIDCKNGRVISWYTAWKPERPFPIDMAGFAVNIKLIFQYPNAVFSNKVPRGFLESDLLTKLKLSRDDVEAKADNCTQILVWHTRTEKPKLKQEEKLIKEGKPSNPHIEV